MQRQLLIVDRSLGKKRISIAKVEEEYFVRKLMKEEFQLLLYLRML